MQRWCRFWGGLWLVPIAMCFLLVGCADDMYSSCTVDEGSACASDSESVSCVEDDNSDCDSQVCARYQGSDPFCTTPCSSDGDCVAGECIRIELQGSSTKYCVEDQDA